MILGSKNLNLIKMTFSDNKKELRNFAFVLGIFFPLLFGFILPYFFGHQFRYWTLFIGFPIIILGLIAPKNLKLIYDLWIQIGNLLGYINSKIILLTIFLFVVQPIALIMKIVGYDPLKRKPNVSSSYREVRKNDNIDLEKIF